MRLPGSYLLFFHVILLFQFKESNPLQSFNEKRDAENILEQIQDVVEMNIPLIRNATDLRPNVLIRQHLKDFYPRLKNINYTKFPDESLKRQIKRILKGSYYPPIGEAYRTAAKHLREVSQTRGTCSYHDRSKCSMAYKPNIKSVFSESQDLDELVYYWTEWRAKTSKEVKDSLQYFVDYYKNSIQLGISKPSELWYYDYDDADFIDELTNVMNLMKPFYLQFHGFLRHSLNKRYGDTIVPPRGPIKQHLIEKVELQSWKKDSIFQNPFLDKKLPNLQAELDSHGFTPLKIVEKSAEFFSSLGVTNLTEKFWRQNVHLKIRGGPDCKSDIFEFGEVQLDYCPKPNFKKLLQTHGDLGRVLYSVHRNSLPFGLNEEACPGFGNALGEAAILSASSPKHIQNIGLLKDYDYDDETSLNRLYRQAIHTLLTIPAFFVHEKLWIEMIDGKIESNQYNCEYWKLMEQYAGIQPPIARTNNDFDFPYKFYEGIVDENGHTRKLMSEFLGYQFYRALCEKCGEFKRGNAYLPLQNCDFFHKKEAGNYLSDMMSMGSKETWRKVMVPLVGSMKVSAAALLEFYEPLNIWLEEENFNNNVTIGWELSNNCV